MRREVAVVTTTTPYTAGGAVRARPTRNGLPARAVGIRWGRVALWGAGGVVIAFLVLPSVLVAVMSFGSEKYLEFPPDSFSLKWYVAYFSDPEWLEPTLFSVRIAGLTALVATLVGSLASLALVRGRVPGRDLVQAAVTAPMVAPGIIVAIALYLVFAPWRLVGTTAGFVLAHAVLTVPYVLLTVSAALSRVDPSLELAAMSLGASRPLAICTVTLPLVLHSVLAGAAFAFLISFDEAVVSFFLSGVTTKTLPRKIFEHIDFDVSPVVAAAGTLLTVLSLLVVAGAEFARARASRRARPTSS